MWYMFSPNMSSEARNNAWVVRESLSNRKVACFFDISFDKAEIHRFSLSVKPYETAFFCGLLRGYYNGLTRDGWWLVTFFWSRWYPDCMEFRYLQVFSCFIPVLHVLIVPRVQCIEMPWLLLSCRSSKVASEDLHCHVGRSIAMFDYRRVTG